MSWYLLHFTFSCCLVMAIFCLFFKRISLFYRLLGVVLLPIVSFVTFYNADFALLESWLVYVMLYLGSLWTLFLYLFILSLKKIEVNVKKRFLCVKSTILFVSQSIILLLLFLIPWAFDTFPLSNIESVLFTLFAPVEGSKEFVLATLKENVLSKSSIICMAVLLVQIILSVILVKKRINCVFSLKFISIVIPPSTRFIDKLVAVQKLSVLILTGCLFVDFLLLPSIFGSTSLQILLQKSVDSEFYKTHYKEIVTLPDMGDESKKNLVILFLESMANNYERYTPELNVWKNKGLNFLPGSESVSGTGWTIAGITSSLCGLPLNLLMGVDEYHGELPSYLPNAVCIQDLLKDNGYNQIFIQGSNADFTQKRQFWTSHGKVSIHDEKYFKKEKMVPDDYTVFWGIEDSKVYSFAKEDLNGLAAENKPFAFYLLTVDTHQPNGYLDSSCHYNEDTQYKKVLRCSSNMIDEFLNWMESQPWFKNTIILVVGDHSMQALAEKSGLLQNEKLYTTAFMLNAESVKFDSNRKFTNLDYPATILEAMGWTLPDHAFGLGRSLLSNEPTMLELYGRDSLDMLLRQRSIQYDYFLFGK